MDQILEEAKRQSGYAEIFSSDATIALQDRTVRKLVSILENYDLGLTAFDVKGEAFEYFLGETFTGGLGEYFTPRNVVEFMVEAIDPKIGEKIIDPFCGTGGFLIYAFELVSEKIRLNEFSADEKERWRLDLSNRSLFGTDWKERTSQACKMNMMVHGDGSSGVFMHDGFINVTNKIKEKQFDLCLTNPPFGSTETDPDILSLFELGAGRKSQSRVILALERCLQLVKSGGRVAIVVIDGALNNSSTRYVRDYIKRHAWIKGVIRLTQDTFEGYGSRAKTSILFLERKEEPDDGTQEPTFMAIARNAGLAPNGAPIPGNELPDILMDYSTFIKEGVSADQHPLTWIGTPEDRLDAEYHISLQEAIDLDVQALRREISQHLTKGRKAVNQLADFQALIESVETHTIQLSSVLEERRIRNPIEAEQLYSLIGVRWWGAGAFIREKKLGKDIKANSLSLVQAGWLIYNRLFAYRGAFAVLKPQHNGCHVSNEFPMFSIKGAVRKPNELMRYIVHCMNSAYFVSRIDGLSTGSTPTSRNRLNQKQFLEMWLEVPVYDRDLARVVKMLDRADLLRSQQEQLSELTQTLRAGVLDMLPKPS